MTYTRYKEIDMMQDKEAEQMAKELANAVQIFSKDSGIQEIFKALVSIKLTERKDAENKFKALKEELVIKDGIIRELAIPIVNALNDSILREAINQDIMVQEIIAEAEKQARAKISSAGLCEQSEERSVKEKQ